MIDLVAFSTKDNKSVEWSSALTIQDKTLTNNKRSVCYIQNSSSGGKYKFQLGSGDQDSFKLLFGISTFQNKIQERSDLNIEIPPSCHELFDDLDNMILETAKDRRSEWWPNEKNVSDEDIEDRYYPILKADPGGKYNPSMKCKISIYDGGCSKNPGNTQVFEYCTDGCTRENGEEYSGENQLVKLDNETDIRKLCVARSRCMPIIQISNIWFHNKQFGVTLDCKMIAIFPQVKELGFFMPSQNSFSHSIKSCNNESVLTEEEASRLEGF